jgi:hypothetical protein
LELSIPNVTIRLWITKPLTDFDGKECSNQIAALRKNDKENKELIKQPAAYFL